MKRTRFATCLSTIFLIGLLWLVPSVGAAEKSFADFDPKDFGYQSVMNLVDEKIITGYPEGTFKPNNAVNRAETAVMFQRALNLETPANVASFKDVREADYFANAAAAAKKAGIFQGTPDGYFGPNDVLTREQMASVLVRAFDLKPDQNVKVQMNDANQVMAVHLEDVQVLYQNGITTGKSNGMFDPKGSVTRAEFSVFMDRAIAKELNEQPKEPQKDSDVKEDEEQVEEKPEDEKRQEEPQSNGKEEESEEAVELEVTSSFIKTTDGNVAADITMRDGHVQMTYDLRNQPDKNKLLSGSISVSKDSTLTLTEIPSPVNFVISEGEVQELQEGANNLAIAEVISSMKVDFELIRMLDSFQIGAILEDKDGNTVDVTVQFLVK